MNAEDAAFAPTAEELGHTESESALEAAPEPTPVQSSAKSATPSVMDDSPFATETMAELYLQQGLRGEALTIYRQLALKRDDPAIHARIAELEADGSPHKSGETVRAFFARLGEKRPDERVELAAERSEHVRSPTNSVASGDNSSRLAKLFSSSEPDAADAAAAQRIAGAFGKPQLGNSQS